MDGAAQRAPRASHAQLQPPAFAAAGSRIVKNGRLTWLGNLDATVLTIICSAAAARSGGAAAARPAAALRQQGRRPSCSTRPALSEQHMTLLSCTSRPRGPGVVGLAWPLPGAARPQLSAWRTGLLHKASPPSQGRLGLTAGEVAWLVAGAARRSAPPSRSDMFESSGCHSLI